MSKILVLFKNFQYLQLNEKHVNWVAPHTVLVWLVAIRMPSLLADTCYIHYWALFHSFYKFRQCSSSASSINISSFFHGTYQQDYLYTMAVWHYVCIVDYLHVFSVFSCLESLLRYTTTTVNFPKACKYSNTFYFHITAPD